ncbi:MAG: FAD-dependent oxidoreductase [Gammaproteobacteria bacterium]|nr:FAD-dependent oxidoreductase [Gammaproteobacteria bacterium]MBA3732052.1 FAD-dependent oxidoreductase [Gammaproteobacteria bacterium]
MKDAATFDQTTCCVVGAGPAGAMLALLLARNGVPVTLLEMHQDFEREFRGDTLHPSVMEIMDELGLAEPLLQLPHTKLRQFGFQTPTQSFTIADFSRLKTKFPYITLIPQARYLEFVIAQARQYPHFTLLMDANVRELIRGDDRVLGVRYTRRDGQAHELRADLTVAADGRFSRLRKLSGLTPVASSPPMDVLWLRMPKRPGDTLAFGGRIGGGHILAILERPDHYQLGYVIAKGSYRELREAGVQTLRASLAELAPELADRVDHLQSWSQVSVLSVESNCLRKWHLPGLLLIGDAAHVMSSVGGVGINYAVQDAVVAANLLTRPLRTGTVHESDLAAMRKERYLPTRVIQTFQAFVQKRVIQQGLRPDATFKPPLALRLPGLRALPARLIGFGIRRARVARA